MSASFENRYYATDEMMMEYVHQVLCRRLKRWGIGLLLLGLLSIVHFISKGDSIWVAVDGVCLFIILFCIIFSPILMIRSIKENDKRIHNGKKFETVVTFDDKISICEGSFSLSVEYSQIVAIYYLKHSYALMFGKNSGIIVSPSGFIGTDVDNFKAFIEKKCNNAKVVS